MAWQLKKTENMYPCPGPNRVSDARIWYTPVGKSTYECTICEECFNKYLKDKPGASDFGVYSQLDSCNCDYNTFYDRCGLEIGGIKVTITNAKTGEKYTKLDNEMANLNGVVHFLLPTCTEYIINIDNLTGNYFTFESGFIGEKKIIVNGGKNIYYPTNLNIQGFETGTNDSFMFISPSFREKNEGYNIEGENTTNIIKLKFCRWKREYNGAKICNTRFDDCRSIDNESARSFSSYKSLSGGATVSGGSYVDNIKTSTTTDNFTQIGGEIEFIIQLVCDQNDSEKYEINKKYYLKKDLEERKKLLSEKEKIESEIAALKIKSSEMEKQLGDIENKLKKYEYLGPYDKTGYLMQF